MDHRAAKEELEPLRLLRRSCVATAGYATPDGTICAFRSLLESRDHHWGTCTSFMLGAAKRRTGLQARTEEWPALLLVVRSEGAAVADVWVAYQLLHELRRRTRQSLRTVRLDTISASCVSQRA